MGKSKKYDHIIYMTKRLILKESSLFRKTKNDHRSVSIAILREGKGYMKLGRLQCRERICRHCLMATRIKG